VTSVGGAAESACGAMGNDASKTRVYDRRRTTRVAAERKSRGRNLGSADPGEMPTNVLTKKCFDTHKRDPTNHSRKLGMGDPSGGNQGSVGFSDCHIIRRPVDGVKTKSAV
jgi:hypothetical protein